MWVSQKGIKGFKGVTHPYPSVLERGMSSPILYLVYAFKRNLLDCHPYLATYVEVDNIKHRILTLKITHMQGNSGLMSSIDGKPCS